MHKKLKVEMILSRILEIRYQLICLLVTFSITSLISLVRKNDFYSNEEYPIIYPISPKKLMEIKATPSIILTGLYVDSFTLFNIESNQFIFDGIVWFEYDPTHISIEMVEKFSFDQGEILKKSKPNSILKGDKVLSKFNVSVKFSSNINYVDFPFDDHYVNIIVSNTYFTLNDAIFISAIEKFVFSEDISFIEWNLVDQFVQYGYEPVSLKDEDGVYTTYNPKVLYSFGLKRAGIRQVLLVLIPLYLVFFICLLSFGFSPETDKSIIQYVASSGITSLIAYRFILQNIVPKVGYFTVVDYIYIVFLIFASIVFFIAMYILHRNAITFCIQLKRIILFVSFHIILNVLFYYLLFVWNR